jgi:long-chain acyl-CoA synthetase
MNVADLILAAGEDEKVAVFHASAAVTYRELRTQVAQVAAGLLTHGCVKGDRIGIWSENNPFFVAAYLGIIRAGLVAVPFQTDLGEESFAKIVRDAGIKNIITSKRFGGRLRPWAEKLGVTLLQETDLRNASANAALPEIDARRDLAALMFTSGSTGAPKGVMVSHRNIECNTRDIIAYLGLTKTDSVMAVLPLHYCFGMSLLHTHLMAGGSLVLNNDFKLFPEEVLRDMQQRECTGLAGIPSTYQILLRKSRFREMQFPALRWFQQAGGKLPNACISEVLSSFPQVKYFLMYGQTEATARLSFLPPERLSDKLGSIGKGLASTKLEVLKQDGKPVTPGTDETGEIVASGDNITLGYWNDADETAKFFRNGRLHTGDIARVDKDGYIFVVERERDMIKSGGNRVSAKEVEEVVAELPEVVEVAVLGTPHELLGEAIKAFVVVVPNASVTPEGVKIHCRKRLPAFKAPEEVIFLQQMPHNGSGKVMKPKLRELAASRAPVENAVAH